jgi:hypothetical protein
MLCVKKNTFFQNSSFVDKSMRRLQKNQKKSNAGFFIGLLDFKKNYLLKTY